MEIEILLPNWTSKLINKLRKSLSRDYCRCGRKYTIHGWRDKKTCYPCLNKEKKKIRGR